MLRVRLSNHTIRVEFQGVIAREPEAMRSAAVRVVVVTCVSVAVAVWKLRERIGPGRLVPFSGRAWCERFCGSAKGFVPGLGAGTESGHAFSRRMAGMPLRPPKFRGFFV